MSNVTQENTEKTLHKYRVFGLCLVPTEVSMIVEAANGGEAIVLALRSDWRSSIGNNDGDSRAAFDWRPTAEKLKP